MERKKPKIAMLGQFAPSSGGICTNIKNIMNSPLKDKYKFLPLQTGSPFYGTIRYSKEKIYSKVFRVMRSLFYYTHIPSKNSTELVHINTLWLQKMDYVILLELLPWLPLFPLV